MPYCQSCGRILAGGESCDCREPENTQIKQQPVYLTDPLHSEPGSSGTKKTSQNLMNRALHVIRRLVCASPADAVFEAAHSGRAVWTILLGLELLLSAASVSLVTTIGFRSFFHTWDVSFGSFVFAAFFFTLAEGFGYGMMIKLICEWDKKQIRFSAAMNMATLGLLPKTAGFAVTICFGLFVPFASIFAASAGAVVTYLILYGGLRKLAPFTKDPVWIFSAGVVLLYVVLTFMSVLLVMPALIGAVLKFAQNLQNYLTL